MNNRLVSVLTILSLALASFGISSVRAPAAHAQGSIYLQNIPLIAQHSDKCLDVPGRRTGLRVQLVQWACNRGGNQTFDMVNVGRSPDGSSATMLRANHSGRCLNVKGASKRRGAAIIQWHCNNKPATRWKIRFARGANAGMWFINENSNLCLDVQRASQRNGAKLIQFPCTEAANQVFDWGYRD